MTDISASGVSILVASTVLFPAGFVVTQFADDADPFDIPEIEIATEAMNVNGEIVTWTTPKPINIMMNIIPGSDDDRNLALLFAANRAGYGKSIIPETVTITASYPDGEVLALTDGRMKSGKPGKSIASSGRMKSNPYGFVFQNITRTFGVGA